ncbi:hypothetical protein ANN_09017 [Periplaneta americana]|uniref:DUF4817 domain-containing protein n=1 Tax=Periplaneta americana TaxID=6978 RepID=A0ABQ8TKN1_PERAM|nr:hypothetical protein ANN_09017 [Periplaneta americana]
MAFTKQSFCVLEYARTSSVVTVQRRFQAQLQKAPPVFNSIKYWFVEFRASLLAEDVFCTISKKKVLQELNCFCNPSSLL